MIRRNSMHLALTTSTNDVASFIVSKHMKSRAGMVTRR